MGIRIHKFMGYGLTNLSGNEDERINWNSMLFDWERNEQDDLVDYHRFIKLKNDIARESDDFLAMNVLDGWGLKDAMKLPRKKRKRTLRDCIAYETECGMDSVLVLQPWACKDWSRHDDTMDYHIESMSKQSDNYVQELRTGIFPFSNSYIDVRDGRKVAWDDVQMWIICTAPGENYDEETLDRFAEKAGFASHKEALKFCKASIPEPISDLIEFTEIFKDPVTTSRQLRPMIYTYWG